MDIKRRGLIIKKIIVMILISVALLINTSCAKEEKITFDYEDQINVLHQLVNKDSNNKPIRPQGDFYIFYNDNDYKDFVKQYFTSQLPLENIDFKTNDLLLINFKWGDKLEGPSYRVDSIVRKGNEIKIVIKNSGFGSLDNKNSGISVEELGYLQLPKGTILPTDIVLINKQ